IYANHIGHKVTLWAHDPNNANTIKDTRENITYLPGIKIDSKIKITNDLQEALNKSELVLLVTPSAYYRTTLKNLAPYLKENMFITSFVKGIENNTHALMSDIFEEIFPQFKNKISYLSGPSFAKELALNKPVNLACASHDIEVARKIQTLLHSNLMRIYTSDDVKGIEIAGALKNVIAIACGTSDGLNAGLSARAALMTRGLIEMTRLGVAINANPITFLGLAGVGDLILTCTGDLSRNRSLGLKLAQGQNVADILKSQKAVAEGYVTAKPAFELAKKLNVDTPIIDGVYSVCYENKKVKEVANKLMERAMKDEFEGIK
ncbi:MAG: NAD(P)H-dependent glycerol-3-phosphate dehydrogenase, partial [Bacteriovoracaceae bacterium]